MINFMKNFISLNGKQVEISDETAKNLTEQFTKKKIEIKSNDGLILYTSEKATIKEAVEEAVENGAILSGANLIGANLSDANLIGAELHCAKFYGRSGTQKLTKKQVPTFLEALGFIIK